MRIISACARYDAPGQSDSADYRNRSGEAEDTRCRNERRRSMRCFGGLPAIRAPLMAPIDIPFCRMLLLGASRGDGDRSVHRLVPGAAKNVTKESERAYLVGYKAHPRDLAGNDVRPNAEAARTEGHEQMRRGRSRNGVEPLL